MTLCGPGCSGECFRAHKFEFTVWMESGRGCFDVSDPASLVGVFDQSPNCFAVSHGAHPREAKPLTINHHEGRCREKKTANARRLLRMRKKMIALSVTRSPRRRSTAVLAAHRC